MRYWSLGREFGDGFFQAVVWDGFVLDVARSGDYGRGYCDLDCKEVRTW
jgi:hypothetical protein